MTTNTENQTSHYPFGETPEEVIRERLEWFFDSVIIDRRDSFAPCPPILNGNTTHPDGRDDLLTVLDALRVAAATGEPDGSDTMIGDRSQDLRISILAALGIDEGGV
ncbi:hypothetical protein [Sinimarinibacterium flocculans]|mgnify:CR=1 FL=1|uniref:hypothetical protein n=1 Tax=Sinimarinibacterium flocculans TaxID=985250 RepID=UPI0024904074|nr:hypothetical protein [Sinimarinibacterium flocculans]